MCAIFEIPSSPVSGVSSAPFGRETLTTKNFRKPSSGIGLESLDSHGCSFFFKHGKIILCCWYDTLSFKYLAQVFVEPGQTVKEGETLVVMEAMKMEVRKISVFSAGSY